MTEEANVPTPTLGDLTLSQSSLVTQVTRLGFDYTYSHAFSQLAGAGVRMRANDNLGGLLAPGKYEREMMLSNVEQAVAGLLKALCIDIDNDHNTAGTPGRVAKMFVNEVMRGRYDPAPDITAFPNDLRLDELYVTGPITVRSMCSHHLVPIVGRAWIGVIPGDDSVIGLSKFNRLVEWVFARPQIQEEATIQLADIIEEKAKPKGLAVLVKATHMCMTWRGVRESAEATMTTSVLRGALRDKPEARAEFMSLVNGGL
jgi:GTP cyclohydrolase IA